MSIISHTADVRLHITGDTLAELFAAGLEGMNTILKENYAGELDKHTLSYKVSLFANDSTALLIDFLSEVLSMSHINKAIFYGVSFFDLTPISLSAQLTGVKVDTFSEDIKAVTYHEAEIIKNEKGQYETTIIFDI